MVWEFAKVKEKNLQTVDKESKQINLPQATINRSDIEKKIKERLNYENLKISKSEKEVKELLQKSGIKDPESAAAKIWGILNTREFKKEKKEENLNAFMNSLIEKNQKELALWVKKEEEKGNTIKKVIQLLDGIIPKEEIDTLVKYLKEGRYYEANKLVYIWLKDGRISKKTADTLLLNFTIEERIEKAKSIEEINALRECKTWDDLLKVARNYGYENEINSIIIGMNAIFADEQRQEMRERMDEMREAVIKEMIEKAIEEILGRNDDKVAKLLESAGFSSGKEEVEEIRKKLLEYGKEEGGINEEVIKKVITEEVEKLNKIIIEKTKEN